MSDFIVVTTINAPSEAIVRFSDIAESSSLIVVGDHKTPGDWNCGRAKFISLSEQSRLSFKISSTLPINHYCRKMIGYLYGLSQGAQRIIDTDDDNIPKRNWGFPEFTGTFDVLPSDLGFINIYRLYTKEHVWPRGLPLSLILKDFELDKMIGRFSADVGVWQGLADEDPDVDAIYRLTNDRPIYFKDRNPVVLEAGTISPFNSQNTVFRKECFPLLYLPAHVTFRFTDILRGLVAQPIMWKKGFRLGFTDATVVQKRNPHDYMKDFESEIAMYLSAEKIVEIVDSVVTSAASMSDNLFEAYAALVRAELVQRDELVTLSAWLTDLEGL